VLPTVVRAAGPVATLCTRDGAARRQATSAESEGDILVVEWVKEEEEEEVRDALVAF
jgi:hypothetical protein